MRGMNSTWPHRVAGTGLPPWGCLAGDVRCAPLHMLALAGRCRRYLSTRHPPHERLPARGCRRGGGRRDGLPLWPLAGRGETGGAAVHRMRGTGHRCQASQGGRGALLLAQA